MPGAVSPVDWEGESTGFAFCFDGGDQSAALIIDGADPSEMLVVFCDFEHPFAGYIFSTQDVFQEGEDIIGAFWSPEGDEQDRVDGYLIEGGKGGEWCGWFGRDRGWLT
jgi:hypothetical protein